MRARHQDRYDWPPDAPDGGPSETQRWLAREIANEPYRHRSKQGRTWTQCRHNNRELLIWRLSSCALFIVLGVVAVWRDPAAFVVVAFFVIFPLAILLGIWFVRMYREDTALADDYFGDRIEEGYKRWVESGHQGPPPEGVPGGSSTAMGMGGPTSFGLGGGSLGSAGTPGSPRYPDRGGVPRGPDMGMDQ